MQETDPEEDEFSVERLFVHEEFGVGAYLNHDIALLKVKTRDENGIRFGSQVQPVCLPPADAAYDAGTNCTIAGWGSGGEPGAGRFLFDSCFKKQQKTEAFPLVPTYPSLT